MSEPPGIMSAIPSFPFPPSVANRDESRRAEARAADPATVYSPPARAPSAQIRVFEVHRNDGSWLDASRFEYGLAVMLLYGPPEMAFVCARMCSKRNWKHTARLNIFLHVRYGILILDVAQRAVTYPKIRASFRALTASTDALDVHGTQKPRSSRSAESGSRFGA